MPFDSAFDDVYRIGILDAAEAVGVRAERLDDQLYSEGMLERIYRQIDVADVIIADVSGRNPNVFYEVGYAHAKEKLCILITDDADAIPFDLKHRRHIVYEESLTFLREELQRHLAWAKQEVETLRESKLRVDQTLTGTLVRDDLTATANVDIKLDIHNQSTKDAQELHGLYLHLGNDWSLSQDGNECPKSASDVEGYEYRYLLRPPMGRLVPAGWTQLRVTGSRLLARKWRGEELRDSYHLTGRALLRVHTSRGNFEYLLPLDVQVDDLPF